MNGTNYGCPVNKDEIKIIYRASIVGFAQSITRINPSILRDTVPSTMQMTRNVGGYRKRHNDTPSFFVPLPSTVVDTNHIYQLKRNYIHATMQTWSEFHQTNRHCGLVYLFISLTRVEEHGLDAHKVSVAQSGCWQWAVHAVCQNWTAPFEAENEDNTLQSERGQRQWVILASFTASDIWSSR